MLDKTFAMLHYLKQPSTLSDLDADGLLPMELLGQVEEEVKALRSLPEIVCLIGSTRFADKFKDENLRLTLQGLIVLGIGADNIHSNTPPDLRISEPQKALLDALQFRKIELSDRVHVINCNGYIGASTYAEVKRARELEKPLTFHTDYVMTWNQARPGTPERMSVRRFMQAVEQQFDMRDKFNY